FSFSAFVNKTALVPNTKWYKNTSNEIFTVTKLKYYITNVKLHREDGLVFTEEDSYHLIKHVDSLSATAFSIKNLPPGNYNGMEFLIGVDSLRNVSGVQTGALDVNNQMFWSWNSGYIFFKMEGDYVSDSVPDGSQFAIH